MNFLSSLSLSLLFVCLFCLLFAVQAQHRSGKDASFWRWLRCVVCPWVTRSAWRTPSGANSPNCLIFSISLQPSEPPSSFPCHKHVATRTHRTRAYMVCDLCSVAGIRLRCFLCSLAQSPRCLQATNFNSIASNFSTSQWLTILTCLSSLPPPPDFV